jgi:hypothetical protein
MTFLWMFFSLSIIGFLIYLCYKDKLKLASTIVLFLTCPIPFVLGYCLFVLPESEHIIIKGPNYPFLPFLIGLSILGLAVASSIAKTGNSFSTGKNRIFGWISVILGTILQPIGLFITFISFYLPTTLGISASNPEIGVIIFIITTFLSSGLLLFASIRNYEKPSNLFRWISFFISFAFINHSFIVAGILIFAFPSEQQVSFPFWAGLATIGYLPYSVVLYFISKTSIPRFSYKVADELSI